MSALMLELLTTLSTAVIADEIGLRLLYARMDFLQALFIFRRQNQKDEMRIAPVAGVPVDSAARGAIGDNRPVKLL